MSRDEVVPRVWEPFLVIFLSRKKRGPDPYLDWKVRLFSGGAVLALVGLGLDSPLLVGSAILILMLGVGLRFLPGGKAADDGSPDQEWAETEHAETGETEEGPGS